MRHVISLYLRVELDGLAVRLERLGVLALGVEHVAEARVDLRVLRVVLQDEPVDLRRLRPVGPSSRRRRRVGGRREGDGVR